MTPITHRLRRACWPLATAIALAAAGCTSPAVPQAVGGPTLTPAERQQAAQVQGGPRSDASQAVRGGSGATGQPGRMLLAMYVIGSDLEDDVEPRNDESDEADAGGALNMNGAATADFLEILRAYEGLSEAQKANVDVIVAFGGARQTGWKGVKTVGLEGLLKDAEDGYFGNAPALYLHDEPEADMGDGRTFQRFLERVQARAAGSAKVFVDVWNHGGSYAGMGPDTTTGNQLSNASTRQALEATKFQADIIGYDACLMGSAEVAAAVHGHFRYMIASEETEPGHGWDYERWLTFVGQHPEATLPEIGKALVDSFIDSPDHQVTRGRTLSMINLEKAAAVTTALDGLARALGGDLDGAYQGVLTSVGQGPKYGSEGKGGDEYAVDLLTFAETLKARVPAAAGAADAVAEAVRESVVYAREDGTKPGSRGLSLFSLRNLESFESRFYNAENASSPTWYAFVEQFMSRGSQDAAPPEIEAAEEEAEGEEETRRSRRMAVSDDVGLEEVLAIHAVQPDPSVQKFVLVGAEPEETDDEARYVLPGWDGFALHLADAAGGKTLVPLEFDSEEDGYSIYTADAQWNGEDALVYLVLDGDRRVVETWAVPYEEDEHGNTLVSREQYELLQGDRLAFYRAVIDVEADSETYEPAPPVTLSAAPTFSWERVAGQGYYFTLAEDMKGQTQTSEVYAVE